MRLWKTANGISTVPVRHLACGFRPLFVRGFSESTPLLNLRSFVSRWGTPLSECRWVRDSVSVESVRWTPSRDTVNGFQKDCLNLWFDPVVGFYSRYNCRRRCGRWRRAIRTKRTSGDVFDFVSLESDGKHAAPPPPIHRNETTDSMRCRVAQSLPNRITKIFCNTILGRGEDGRCGGGLVYGGINTNPRIRIGGGGGDLCGTHGTRPLCPGPGEKRRVNNDRNAAAIIAGDKVYAAAVPRRPDENYYYYVTVTVPRYRGHKTTRCTKEFDRPSEIHIATYCGPVVGVDPGPVGDFLWQLAIENGQIVKRDLWRLIVARFYIERWWRTLFARVRPNRLRFTATGNDRKPPCIRGFGAG